jgi:hypothetical protein
VCTVPSADPRPSGGIAERAASPRGARPSGGPDVRARRSGQGDQLQARVRPARCAAGVALRQASSREPLVLATLEAFANSGIQEWPLVAPAQEHMGVLPSDIGAELVMRLQAGELRVGEVLSRGRRQGHSPQSALASLQQSGFGTAVEPRAGCIAADAELRSSSL